MQIADVVSFLKGADDFVILTHRQPDGDALGSAYGLLRVLSKIGKRAKVLHEGENLSEKFQYLTDGIEEASFEPKTVIAVDVADVKLLPHEYKETYKDIVDLCIDHHGSNTHYAKQYYVDSYAAATGEIIYQIEKELDVEIDIKIAEALYTAISTDTGCFKFGNTTSQTHSIASELMKTGMNFLDINRKMFESYSKERLAIECLAINSIEYSFDSRCATLWITREMMQKTGALEDDLEGLSSIPRMIKGVRVGITVKETETGFKVSVRTAPGYNACAICAELGGGGHEAAAGCFIKGSHADVREKLTSAVEKHIQKE